MPKPPAPAVPAADKPPRKAVEKLPAGSVAVGLPAYVLSDEEADALYFGRTRKDPRASPEHLNRRDVAEVARAVVRDAAKAAARSAVKTSLGHLRQHRHETALAEAEKRAKEAVAEVERLKAQKLTGDQVSPLAEQPEDAKGRLSAVGAAS